MSFNRMVQGCGADRCAGCYMVVSPAIAHELLTKGALAAGGDVTVVFGYSRLHRSVGLHSPQEILTLLNSY